jgi:hypothetical protein
MTELPLDFQPLGERAEIGPLAIGRRLGLAAPVLTRP